jgi:putative phosphoribosyl transferase
VEMVAREVETLYCANVRGGYSYAVASAYLDWSDIEEEEVVKMLERLKLLYPE